MKESRVCFAGHKAKCTVPDILCPFRLIGIRVASPLVFLARPHSLFQSPVDDDDDDDDYALG